MNKPKMPEEARQMYHISDEEEEFFRYIYKREMIYRTVIAICVIVIMVLTIIVLTR